MTDLREKNESLWLLVASPAIWAGHFLLSYISASIWCAKASGGSLANVRMAITAFTALALAGIGIIGWIGRRRHGHGDAPPPRDDDTPEDRRRFLGFATLLLSALSAVAVIYAALVVFFFGRCY